MLKSTDHPWAILEDIYFVCGTIGKSWLIFSVNEHSQILDAQRCWWLWRRGVVVITTAQLHSSKPEPRFCAGSNPAPGGLEIRDGEDFWQWSRLEIRLNAFRRSTIPQNNSSSSSSSTIFKKYFQKTVMNIWFIVSSEKAVFATYAALLMLSLWFSQSFRKAK